MLSIIAFLLASGCSRNLGALIRTGPDDPGERIVGMYPCEAERAEVATIDPTRPLTVLVHGCNSSGARFETLSGVFEAHGQQTLCFNYNDIDFLNTSATQLAIALGRIQQRMEPHEITVLGHSQGGLIARRAMQSDLPRHLDTREGFTYRLVTVSSPFDGIQSSADCSQAWLHALSLTITLGVCMAIAGNKWTEIPPGSRFITNPAPLVSQVTSHLQIVTDEAGSCRSRGRDGRCETDDFVFSLDEQYSDLVLSDPRVTAVEVRSGHAAVVGENREVPEQLIAVLAEHGVLAPVPRAHSGAPPPGPEERREEIASLVERLYAPRAE